MEKILLQGGRLKELIFELLKIMVKMLLGCADVLTSTMRC